MRQLPRPRLSLVSAGVLLAVIPVLFSAPARLTTPSPPWNVMPSPNLKGAATELASVSCVSLSFCVAVGDAQYPDDGPDVPVVESWNGASWNLVRIPLSSMLGLSAVSCPSTTFCMAVGLGPSSTFVLSFNGRRWTLKSFPNWPLLNSISCTSQTFCVAVGGEEGNYLSAVKSWDGKEWKTEKTPRLGRHGVLVVARHVR
jgi:hypothetical protein